MIPTLFISHGAPTLAAEDNSYTKAWAALGREIPRPESILAISAHWDTPAPAVSGVAEPKTIHDFSGFPRELYEISYPAAGAPGLAQRVRTLLGEARIECGVDAGRGLDHGAWVPLRWMYPDADIPVTQLSVQSRLGARHHHQVGRALAPLRGEGVLVIGSGGIVHNLRELDWSGKSAEPFVWARDFNDWIAERVQGGALEEMLDYRSRAPQPARAHPTEEHFVPFFAALGAGGPNARRIALGFDLGSLGMDCYLFK